MSLRARLTLLYTTLLGGILLLFGLAVYLIISFLLIAQVDRDLASTFEEIRANTRVESVGNMEIIRLPSLDLTVSQHASFIPEAGQSIATAQQEAIVRAASQIVQQMETKW